MVEHMIATHDLDRERVFAVGLSAGGAMTSALLASYPDVFRAGAVIAGLPYGAASSMSEALEAMRQGRSRTSRQLGDLVFAAGRHPGPWPRVSVWHGSTDVIVNPVNAEHTVQQWLAVHELGPEPTVAIERPDLMRRIWRDSRGVDLVETVTIPGMAHGVPLGGTGLLGNVSPYHFDVGVSSTEEIARFFGLAAPVATQRRQGIMGHMAAKRAADALPRDMAAAAPPSAERAGVLRRLMRRFGLRR
jgi:poly(3-hydroxybutyrate) depolymerase